MAAGKKPAAARRAGALGRKVKVTGAHLVFRPQPTLQLLWALGDEETRKAIEAAHERAIALVLAWIEDDAAVIRYGPQGIHRTRPAHGLVAARFRHYEARSGMPLLHDHLLLSLKGLRPKDGVWGAVHSTALLESAVAASALYNEVVMAEVCEALGLASEPRTVTPGRRPVMEVAGVPHELIRWTSRRSAQIAACLTDLEHEYVTATDDDGNLKFAPVVSERARAKLNRIAALKTRPAKPRPRSLTQLRQDWRDSARAFLAAGADIIDYLLERARAAAPAIRARVAAVVDVGLAAVAVTATVFVTNKDGCFHRRHLLAEARRHLALVQRGRRREPGLDEMIVKTAIAAHCTDITEARTERGEEPDYRLYTARWAPHGPSPARRRPTAAPDHGADREPPADPAGPLLPLEPGEWDIPRVPLLHDRAVIASTVLSARLRSALRTGRDPYDVFAHQQAAMPEQLLLFGQEGRPARKKAGPVDVAALRTGLEALELTADQLSRLGRAGRRLRKDSNQRAHQAAAGSAPSAQGAPAAEQDDADGAHPVRQDNQQAHRPQEPGPYRGRDAGH
ncbi:relaxase domain-containing protein [Streptomyces muensis]|uniref:Relaxase domain-containing protein n=1 Tax=Streptomyces muensis TaxID=1077944 RepID=A0A9X1Q220_STRM4|nr:relaxase domain-containing protein [Streptomyces muensis]